jgi:hypothetical protein
MRFSDFSESPDTLGAALHLRVMPEFASTGLWRPRHRLAPLQAWREVPVRECEPADVGLSPGLQARLHAWCDWYDQLLLADVPGRALPPTLPAWPAFAAAGLALAQAVKAELPQATVTYFDEARFEAGQPRQDCLYEVVRARP